MRALGVFIGSPAETPPLVRGHARKMAEAGRDGRARRQVTWGRA